MDHASLKGGKQELEIMIQNTKWKQKRVINRGRRQSDKAIIKPEMD